MMIYPRSPGVYGWLNTINGKWYVGSTNNIRDRRSYHRSLMSRGKHFNGHMQAAWDKYGEGAFEFRILELCGEDMLLAREQAWMDHYGTMDRSKGYNMQNANRTVKTPEMLEKMRAHLWTLHQNRPRASQEQKDRTSKSLMGHPGASNRKVEQLSGEGKVIQLFGSIKEAKDATGNGNLDRALNDPDRVANGFKWRYANANVS